MMGIDSVTFTLFNQRGTLAEQENGTECQQEDQAAQRRGIAQMGGFQIEARTFEVKESLFNLKTLGVLVKNIFAARVIADDKPRITRPWGMPDGQVNRAVVLLSDVHVVQEDGFAMLAQVLPNLAQGNALGVIHVHLPFPSNGPFPAVPSHTDHQLPIHEPPIRSEIHLLDLRQMAQEGVGTGEDGMNFFDTHRRTVVFQQFPGDGNRPASVGHGHAHQAPHLEEPRGIQRQGDARITPLRKSLSQNSLKDRCS